MRRHRLRSDRWGIRSSLGILVLGILCGTGLHAAAQQPEPEGLGDSRNTGRAAGAVIQPFDRIDIRVKREPQLSDIYTVSPSGTLSFPLIGIVQATGRKVGEVAEEIQQRLSSYLRRPDVEAELLTVERAVTGITEPSLGRGGYSVYITGAVKEPGVYYLLEPINPLQLMVRAGGLDNQFAANLISGNIDLNLQGRGAVATQIFPDLSHVSVVDREGNVRFLDLTLMGQEDLDLDPLDPGDTVLVPGHHGGSYAIYGWVRRPGVYPLRQPILLTEALAQADPDRRFSDLTKVKVFRGDRQNPEAYTVNVDDLHAKKRADLFPVIRPGDTIYVPRNFFSRWLDIVDSIRGAREVTDDVEEIRDHFTLRDIERD